jgi:hypothetical protein
LAFTPQLSTVPTTGYGKAGIGPPRIHPKQEALAVSAVEHLEHFVAEGPTDEDSVLEVARFEMTNALK